MSIYDLQASDVVEAIRQQKYSATEIAEALIVRAEETKAINALVNFDPELFLEAAKDADEKQASGNPLGPLHGLPLIIKDNIDIAGFTTTASTPALANHRPAQTSPVAEKLLQAGAIVMSKVNMHELAFSPGITRPEGGGDMIYGAHGNARNPYDLERSPAGSSTGTAAGVGARIAPAGLGSDTGGSVRNPAAWCGVSGLRPTIKRYDQRGVVPISWTRDTIGPMARSVGDLALLDNVITGEQSMPLESLVGIRLGVDRDFHCTDADPDIVAIFERELKLLADGGAEIVEVSLAGLDALLDDAGQALAMYEIPRALPKYLNASGAKVTMEEIVDNIAAGGLGARLKGLMGEEGISEDIYQRSMEVSRPALQQLYQNCIRENGIDALVFPSTMVVANRLNDEPMHIYRGKEVSHFAMSSRNVQPASIGGSPGLTVAAGLTPGGLPCALGFDGLPGNDPRLLSIGMAYEALRAPIPAPKL